MWQFLVNLVAPWFGALSTWSQGLIGWAFSLVGAVATAVVGALVSMLPESWQVYLAQTPWESVFSLYAALQYCFPIKEVTAIGVASIVIAAGVRFVRWLMAVIPGVRIFGNGIGPFGGA